MKFNFTILFGYPYFLPPRPQEITIYSSQTISEYIGDG